MDEQQEITPDEYRQQVLKRNFANRCAEYEDAIARLQTRIAMLEQALQQQQVVDVPESPSADVELPPPPAPSEE